MSARNVRYRRIRSLCFLTGLALAVVAVAHAADGWLPPATVAVAGNDAGSVAVSMDSGGGAVAVWTGTSSDYLQTAVRPRGGPFGAPQLVTPPGRNPEVASAPSGAAFAVWESGPRADAVVMAAFRAAGDTFGPAQSLGHGFVPDIAVDGSGRAVAVWQGRDGIVRAAFATVNGAFGPPQDLGPGLRPRVAMNRAGVAAAAWSGSPTPHNIQAAISRAGGAFGAPEGVGDGFSVQVAIDGGGRVVVVWTKPQPIGSDTTVQAAIRPAGRSFGGIETLSPPTVVADYDDVAANDRGDVVAVWRVVPRGLPPFVQAATLSAGATVWEPRRDVPGAAGSTFVSTPRVAVGPQGTAFVVWPDRPNGVVASIRAPGGTFGEARVVGPGDGVSFARVAVDQLGDAIAVWSRRVVQAAWYDGAGVGAAPVASCTTLQLRVSVVFSAGRRGTAGGYIGFTNRGSAPCRLTGWPKVVAYGDAGKATTARHVRSTMLGPRPVVKGVPVVTLRRGERADAVFGVGDHPRAGRATCPRHYKRLRVTPPGNSRNVLLSAWLRRYGHYLPACTRVKVTMVVPASALHRG
jgi:hypothetical protein